METSESWNQYMTELEKATTPYQDIEKPRLLVIGEFDTSEIAFRLNSPPRFYKETNRLEGVFKQSFSRLTYTGIQTPNELYPENISRRYCGLMQVHDPRLIATAHMSLVDTTIKEPEDMAGFLFQKRPGTTKFFVEYSLDVTPKYIHRSKKFLQRTWHKFKYEPQILLIQGSNLLGEGRQVLTEAGLRLTSKKENPIPIQEHILAKAS